MLGSITGVLTRGSPLYNTNAPACMHNKNLYHTSSRDISVHATVSSVAVNAFETHLHVAWVPCARRRKKRCPRSRRSWVSSCAIDCGLNLLVGTDDALLIPSMILLYYNSC